MIHPTSVRNVGTNRISLLIDGEFSGDLLREWKSLIPRPFEKTRCLMDRPSETRCSSYFPENLFLSARKYIENISRYLKEEVENKM